MTHSYDLIAANILSRPLITMSGLLCRLLRTSQLGGGTLILSGFLESDIRWVIAPYMSRGLQLKKVNICKGWATLVLARMLVQYSLVAATLMFVNRSRTTHFATYDLDAQNYFAHTIKNFYQKFLNAIERSKKIFPPKIKFGEK